MMDHLEVSDALPDFDNIDVDLDGSTGFELGSNDFDALLGAQGGNQLDMNESDIDALMKGSIAEEPDMGDSGNFDHLKTMPIAEVDEPDMILGLEPRKETFNSRPKPLEAQTVPQWNQQAQHNDPLLGNLRRDPMNQPDSIQMIVDQGIHGAAQNNMLPPMGQNNPNITDLQNEKQRLMERLNEINMREAQPSNNFRQQNRPNNGFVLQRNEHIPQGMSQSNNMFLQDQPLQMSSVSSIGGLGNKGETPLQSFLRAGRKSHMTGGQQPRASASVFSQNFGGAPKAASIFSHLPSDLEAIASQSELQVSNSFLNHNESQSYLVASMDRSAISQEMVRKLSSRSLSRQNSGISTSSGAGNASWGIDAPRKSSGFRTSGIITKHASESHLLRKGGLSLSKSRIGSTSRENALYNMMKRNSSKNLIKREDSHQKLMAKRRSGSKHKLSLSRSVPALMVNNGGGSMSHGTQNAVW